MLSSRFFLFYMISLSVVSCSAMDNKQLTKKNSDEVISYVPILNQLANGKSLSTVVFNIVTGTINGLETARQGYQAVKNSPTKATITNTVVRGAQVGADAVATHAHSAGVTLYGATNNLLEWIYSQRSQQNQLTFNQALSRYNQQMNSILSASNKKECKQNILASLTTIKTDISGITELINIAKNKTENNSSGIRTTIIDYVIKEVELDKITKTNANDYVNIINKIAQFSKSENGENNLEESTIVPAINNEKELLSELEEITNPNSNAFSEFINKYMKNDPAMQTVLENKKNQKNDKIISQSNKECNINNNANSNQLSIEKLAQYEKDATQMASDLKEHTETIRALTDEKTKLENQYKEDSTKWASALEEHKKTITTLTDEKTALEKDKTTLNNTIAEQEKQLKAEQKLKANLEQEKTALENQINHIFSYIKIGSGVITVSAIAFLMHYLDLYSKCVALLHQA